MRVSWITKRKVYHNKKEKKKKQLTKKLRSERQLEHEVEYALDKQR